MVPLRHLEYVLHTYMYIHNRGVKLKVPESRYREKEKDIRKTKRDIEKDKDPHILMRETASTIKHTVEDKEKEMYKKKWQIYNMYIHTYIQCGDHREQKRKRRKTGNNKHTYVRTYVLLVSGRMKHVADEKNIIQKEEQKNR